MSDSNSQDKSDTNIEESKSKKVTPLQCLTGATISGLLGYGLYLLTSSIAQTFAAKPISSSNQLIVRIAATVRSLIVSTVSLATFFFGMVALGLILLSVQLLIQAVRNRPAQS